jgi:hypothetical protein
MRHTNRTSSREVGHKVFCHGGQQNLVTPYIFYIYIYDNQLYFYQLAHAYSLFGKTINQFGLALV